MAVAALGDRSEPTGSAAGVLRGYESEECHQLARMSEAADISKLSHERDRGYDIDPAQTHQRLDHRAHAPGLKFGTQCSVEPLDALVGVAHRASVLRESDMLGRVDELHRGQITLVGQGPRALAAVTMSVPQQQ